MWRGNRVLPTIAVVLAAGLLSCGEDRVSGPFGVGEPRFEISDGTHGALALRNPHFFWLSPLVPQPDASSLGTFAPDVRPQVRLVCWETTQQGIGCDPTTAIATFTVGAGIVVDSDHYHLNLDTKLYQLQTSSGDGGSYTTYRLQVLTPALTEFGGPFEFGFADLQLGENGKEAKNLATGVMVGLVDGRTLPAKFRIDRGGVEHELKTNTAGNGHAALCQINCSVTVLEPDRDTEASLSDANGRELTAMLVLAGDVSETKVLVIDEREEQGPATNCATSTNVEKRNCFRYVISPDREPPNPPDFNNPVRFGICAFGVPLGPGTFWRILEVDDDGFVNRPPETHVEDFLPCTSPSLGLSGGPLGRLASAALNWLVPPLHAAGDTEHHGGFLQDLSDLFWALEAEMSALTAGGPAPAGTSVPMTVRVMATHQDPDVPLEGAEVTFSITAGAGSLTPPAVFAVVGTPTSTSVTLLTGSDGKATVNWTVALGTNTLQVTSPDAETADGNPLTITTTGLDQAVINFEVLADGSSIVGKTPFMVSNQLASLGATFSATQGGTPTICTDPFNSSNHVIAVAGSDPCSTASNEGKTLDIKFTASITTVEFDEIVPAGKGSPFVCHPSGSTAVASSNDFGTFRVVHWVITHTAPIEEICVGAATGEVILVDNIKVPRPVQLIAFRSDRDGVCCSAGEIYVMNANGTNPARLTTDAAIDEEPAWSPDGKRIAFTSHRDGNREIYVMNADGTSQFRLTHHLADDGAPTWHPDGTRILFTSTRDGNAEVYVVNANGSIPVNLTNNPANDFGPAFSPDGSKLAFYSNRDGNFELYAIVNGVQVRLTNDAASDVGPRWSPDGAKIAFTSERDGNREVYVINADGSNPVRLTTNPLSDDEPSWSPEGTRIVFRSVRSDGTSGLYVMNANGSNPVRLTGSAGQDQDPDWWP